MRTGLPMVLATLAVLFLGYLGYVFWFGGGGRADLQVLEIDGEVVLTRAGQPAQNVEIGASLETDDGLRVGEGGRAVVGVGAETRLTLEEQSPSACWRSGRTACGSSWRRGASSALVRPGRPRSAR
ncbi:MAG: hypothetical protein IPK67_19435 [Planctomycetes bacterium]|nr:hypothetical protein [Planctomycetota bacterium]